MKFNLEGQTLTLKEAMTTQYNNIINKLGVIDNNIVDTKLAVDNVLNQVIDMQASLQENINRIEKMEIALTILEKKFPQRAKDIKEARTWLGKVKYSLKQKFCTKKGLLKTGLALAGATACATFAATLVPPAAPAFVLKVVTIASSMVGGALGSNIV